MKLLIDTHLLLWAAGDPSRVPSRSRPDFRVDARRLRSMLLASGYEELAVTGEHAVAVGPLEPIHKDAFDRLLLAQAVAEEATLLTSDATLARYQGPILKV